MQIFVLNIISEPSQSLLLTYFYIFIYTFFICWPFLKHKCCLRREAVLRTSMVLKFLKYIGYIKIKKSGPSSRSLYEKKCILFSVLYRVFNINWNIGKGCQSTSQNDTKKPLSYCHCQELKTVFLRWKLYCTCWAARTFWYKIFVRQGECAVATSSHFRPRLRVDNKISFPIASKIWWNPMQLFLSGKRRKIFPKGTSKIYI